jgi:hypothetical protein
MPFAAIFAILSYQYITNLSLPGRNSGFKISVLWILKREVLCPTLANSDRAIGSSDHLIKCRGCSDGPMIRSPDGQIPWRPLRHPDSL